MSLVPASLLPSRIADLRIALFSGNYNMTVDGANKALNRLMQFMLDRGAAVRVYSPVAEMAAFEPAGELVALPSVPFPGRGEYRFPTRFNARVQHDLEGFAPNIVHFSSPDLIARKAQKWAAQQNLPTLASVHTRFETYLRYYRLGFLEPAMVEFQRRFYQRCDALVAPSEGYVEVLRAEGMNRDISLWTRGVDRELLNPARRSMAWRRTLGIADDEVAIGFLGRLVLEKGLDVVAATTGLLRTRGVPHRVLAVGDGPAREWFATNVPGTVFTGFLGGEDLARGIAGMDMLFNPSVTEAFGNVTLEAMACGLPVVAAVATGSSNLVEDGVNGRLIAPDDLSGFAEAIASYVSDPALRARHGAAGLARAALYSWDAINQTVADKYLALVAAKSR